MKKRGIQPLDEPHIVQVIYDKDGRRIGAIADNYVVKTKAEVNQILDNIARIYGDHLRRKAEREYSQVHFIEEKQEELEI